MPVALTILGGGPAGLAVGFYAHGRGIDFRLLEAGPRTGGNATTFRFGGFRYDSGAHRLHDRDAETTAETRRLLGPELLEIDAPSQILSRGKFIEFPLSTLTLLKGMGPRLLRPSRDRAHHCQTQLVRSLT